MSLKNSFIGSPLAVVRATDWLTESDAGMSGVGCDGDPRIQTPEKSGLSCAAHPTANSTIRITADVVVIDQ